MLVGHFAVGLGAKPIAPRIQCQFILLPTRGYFDPEEEFRLRSYRNAHITDWRRPRCGHRIRPRHDRL